MRLIDADAMAVGLAEIVNEEKFVFMTVSQVMEMIDKQPTLDTEKHGYWELINNDYIACSLCGEKLTKNRFPPYCDNCGASMTKGKSLILGAKMDEVTE